MRTRNQLRSHLSGMRLHGYLRPIVGSSRLWLASALAVLGLFATTFPIAASAADLKEGVEQLAAAVAKGVPEGKQLRVAVTDFADLQGITSDLGRYVAERMTTRLAQIPKFRVIERRRLTQILGELRFGTTDLVDPAKAKQLGRLAGVDALVVGSVSDVGTIIELDARVIDIETADTLIAAVVAIAKDDTVKAMLERGRQAAAEPSAPATPLPAPGAPSPAPAPHSLKYQEFQQFRVEVDALKVSADRRSVTVLLTYVSKSRDQLTIALDSPGKKTIAIDNQGHSFEYRQGSGLDGGWGHLGGRGWSPRTSFLTLSPGARATASFVLKMHLQRGQAGSAFIFTSEQLLVTSSAGGDPQPGPKFNITIRDIQPR